MDALTQSKGRTVANANDKHMIRLTSKLGPDSILASAHCMVTDSGPLIEGRAVAVTATDLHFYEKKKFGEYHKVIPLADLSNVVVDGVGIDFGLGTAPGLSFTHGGALIVAAPLVTSMSGAPDVDKGQRAVAALAAHLPR